MIEFSEKNYDPRIMVRIVNPKQVTAYMKHGVMPVDFYVGANDTLVWIFKKEETANLYEQWLSHDL